ncbi:hypothetical protein P280DRAFT_554354 [Massarina eburnea CBS 473.64]|uniref:Calcofluor white hypersensitive protein n=1 Tax=Massarina eburnea CBS 473.64 TaxID=1395130 RepID=A0A6A6RI91_9PLEO|nr:hypothetical protein P280DRAFT_554354 [Massarina eburnea CBS 473.64]
MAGRFVKIGGIAAAAGGAFYLYSAGGDPKLAQKKIEHDAASASAKVRGDLPGHEKEAKKAGEEGYEALRARAEDLANDAKAKANQTGRQVDRKLDQYRNDASQKLEDVRQTTGKDLNAAVDKFDKSVTEGASKSKSWIGSWFG